jgi:GNAT superfamily N-acetyltransferase
MWARLPAAEFRARGAPGRRAAIRRIVNSEGPPGVLAYEGDRAVGWAAIGPRATYRRFETSRVLAPVDDKTVWSVPCFFVAREHRGRGLTAALLDAACAFAASHGARIVEGYPVDTRGARQPAAFLWNGLPQAFAAAGFREVERRSPSRPIVRRAVRARRAGAGRG